MSAPQSRDSFVLFSDVLNGVDRVVRGEVAVAKTEVRQNMRAMRRSAVQFVMAAMFGVIALNLLAGASVAALVAMGLTAGTAGLTVGAVLLMAAYLCISWGLSLLEQPRPQAAQTFQNVGKGLTRFKPSVPAE